LPLERKDFTRQEKVMSERESQLNQMYRRLKFVLNMLTEANQQLQANATDDTPSKDDATQSSPQENTNEGEQNHG
jgi:hypothetical protein